jgi:putative thiamine transport system permease protein
MDRLRRLSRHGVVALLAAVVALPLAGALALAVAEGADAAAWRAFATDAPAQRGLVLSVWVALASTALAVALTLWLTTALHGSRAWQRLARGLGPMLAVPHAAFAIGVMLLVMPSGLLARLAAPTAGWDAPPAWQSVNDPHGLALIAVLVAKEVPFLLWNVFALFSRPEVAAAVQRQLTTVRGFGYGQAQAWWRVIWPQWLPRLALPMAAVLAYSLSVVDLALIIGPLSPPTLAVLVWQDLNDASAARNAQGAAGALALALALAVLCMVLAAAALIVNAAWRAVVRRGHRRAGALPAAWPRMVAGALTLLYGAAVAMLVFVSIATVWTFPSLAPQRWSAEAWQQVAHSARSIGLTLALGAAASAAALVIVVTWLENAPPAWDRAATAVLMGPLVLPALLLVVGLYRGALALSLDGTVAGLGWVHTLMVLPYAMIMLAPAWRSFDPRYEWTALALARSRWRFWWRVKWPMLRAPIAAALAVGFAVSVAQYLPTLFIGAGRHASVTTEAVTLASGGQRNLAAAFALLQALLPALGFWAARAAARPSYSLPRAGGGPGWGSNGASAADVDAPRPDPHPSLPPVRGKESAR